MARAALVAVFGLLLMAQAPPPARVSDLAWMSGRWLTGDGARWTEEIWSGPRGGTLMGFSWSGEGAAISEYEYIRIQPGEDDEIIYLAQANGGAGVGFYLVRAEGTSATFENLDHDFRSKSATPETATRWSRRSRRWTDRAHEAGPIAGNEFSTVSVWRVSLTPETSTDFEQ